MRNIVVSFVLTWVAVAAIHALSRGLMAILVNQ